MRLSRGLASLLVLPAILLAGPAALAQTDTDLAPALPPDTPVYVRTAGLDALLSEVAASRMLADGEKLRQIYEAQIRGLWPMLQEMTDVKADDLAKLARSVKSVHLALFGLGRQPLDSDFILAAQVAEPDLARAAIAKLLARFGKREEFAGEVGGARVMAVRIDEERDLYYAIRENLVVATFSPERMSTLLAGLAEPPDKSLATSPAYRAGALKAGTGDALFAWADGPAFFTMLQGTMSPRDIRDFDEADRILSFRKLRSLSVISGGGQTRARLIYPPDHPWMAAFRGETGPSGLLPFMPADTFFGLVDSGSIAVKWGRVRRLLTDEETFPFAKEIKRGLGEAEKMLGMSFDEIAGALGSEWCFFFPVLDGRISRADDNVVFAAEIAEKEKFTAVFDKLMKSEAIQEMTKELGAPVVEKYGGFDIHRPPEREDQEGHGLSPCMAIGENVLLMSPFVDAVKAAIDAKTKGAGMVATARPYLAGLPGSSSKFAAMDMRLLCMEERDFTPLLALLREGALVAATTDEAPGRLDVVASASLPEFVGILVGGEMLEERYRAERAECLSNLKAIGEAVRKYREKNEGRNPPGLAALVPDYLPKERLVCPFDEGDEDVGCSYHEALGRGEESRWYVDAWCPHLLHGRLVLQRGGRSYSTRESSFRRSAEQQGFEVR